MNKYIIFKTRKIISAIYLVTDLIKDRDALKWDIRREAINLVSYIFMLDTTIPLEKDNAVQIINSTFQKIISFLNISLISCLISKMNADIIIQEIEALMDFIHNDNVKQKDSSGYILSDSFFATDNLPNISNSSEVYSKGQTNLSKTFNNQSNNDRNKVNSASISVKGLKDKKDNRKNSIINLLKKDSNLTIKDFVKVIKDCSEKTIQRDLIDLVEKGIVKKEGERRWSKYSLNS